MTITNGDAVSSILLDNATTLTNTANYSGGVLQIEQGYHGGTNTFGGNVHVNGTLSGNASGLTNLPLYSEQTWNCTAPVMVLPATTVLRLTTGTPSMAGHAITLPAAPTNGQTLEIVVPPSTGTVPTDPVTGGPVHFVDTTGALSFTADPTYTRIFRLIAGAEGWAVDTSVARQGGYAAFSQLMLSGPITLLPQSSAPGAPAAGVTLYADANSDLHALHADGTNHTLSAH